MTSFEKRKQDCLRKPDKSNIGIWDERIITLCGKINNKTNFYTTSSCAGRIVLLKNEDKKAKNKFLFRTHNKTSFDELKKEINKIKEKGLIYFKQEPCILHVACNNFEDAKEFLNKAKLAGWKKGGIMSARGRFMLELMSTENIVFPVIKNGKILVSDEFLKIIAKEANKKLEKAWCKIEKLEEMI